VSCVIRARFPPDLIAHNPEIVDSNLTLPAIQISWHWWGRRAIRFPPVVHTEVHNSDV